MSAISNIAGMGLGLFQSKQAKKLQKEGEAISPPLEDPRMTSLLDSVKRKATSVASGTDSLSVEMTKQAGENLATTQSSLTSGVGGDSGVLLSGLRKTQLDANKSLSSARAVSGEQEKYYSSLAGTLADKISARKFDLTMYKRLQKLREAAELKKTANANISGGMAGLSEDADKLKDRALDLVMPGGGLKKTKKEIAPID